MVLVADYQSDLGELIGRYSMIIENLTEIPLDQVLPSELFELYTQDFTSTTCRVNAVIPRKIKLRINVDTFVFIELPIKPTIAQLQVIKENIGAITVETIGEQIKYNPLKHYLR